MRRGGSGHCYGGRVKLVLPTVDQGAAGLRILLGVPFGRIDPGLGRDFNPRHRGWVGQWLERQLGLANGSAELDFADGELKSFESRRGFRPTHGQVALATVQDPDALVQPFEQSVIATKLRRVLFAGFRRPSEDPREWYLSFVFVYALAQARGSSERLAAAYERITARFAADARYADEASIAHDYSYRDDFLILKNKDSRQGGAYAVTWSAEHDGPVSARRLGFYLTPAFFDFAAAHPEELQSAWTVGDHLAGHRD